MLWDADDSRHEAATILAEYANLGVINGNTACGS